MAVRILFDQTNNVIQPTFNLATRSGRILGSIPHEDMHVADNLNSYFELFMRVNKHYDNAIQPLWDSIQNFKLLYCPEWDVFFQITVEVNEADETVKDVSAISLGEAELSQINLHGFEANTESDIAREDYRPTVLFNETDPEVSLLNRMLEKAPHYKIEHVDASIAKIQRTFAFDKRNIYDAFQAIAAEIGCIFIIDSGMDESGKPKRAIRVYDLESYCLDCKQRGNFLHTCSNCGGKNIKVGYGENTNIFISVDNLADEVRYTTDVDSVKNCFKLEAGDDLMTATLANYNPNGSNYIWHISDELKSDMSNELVSALEEYDKQYVYYQSEHVIYPDLELLTAYNALIQKYKNYRNDLGTIPESIVGYSNLMNAYYDTIDLYLFLHDELMPFVEMEDTNAAEQAELLDSTSLSPVAVTDLETCSASTATSAVLSMAKAVVSPKYRVKVKDSTYLDHVWYGTFSVTNYSDETDTADSAMIRVSVTDNYENYIKQRILKSVASSGQPTDVNGLFSLDLDDFKIQIKKYCLVSLQSFADACQGCIDILIEQGVANADTWENTQEDLYNGIYLPYYYKLKALQDEIHVREKEIEIVTGKFDVDGSVEEDGMQTFIQRHNDEIHDVLNFEKTLGHDLWLELSAYRRDDIYHNPNYISDGLTNKQLFASVKEFFETAQKEIVKSATLQHSISSTLKNLLVMKEFKEIVRFFKVGNWIQVCVNDEVYRLRLISYEIDFDNIESLPVEFSDVTRIGNDVTDMESIKNQAESMATSYDSIKHQAAQGKDSKETLNTWVSDGLALTKLKIVDSAKDQNISWDARGFLCRQYLPITDTYDEKQLKIINRGLYLTDDDWLTSKAGIGDFSYYDPETGEIKEAYGVIADTLIGNLILSEKVGIYNMNNSIILDENGVVITTDSQNVSDNKKVFVIRKKNTDENGVETLENLLYVNNDGDLVFKGTLQGANGEFSGSIIATSIDGSYFRVDSSAMGFYTSGGSPMLHYEDGTMTLNGAIKAISKNGSYFQVDSETMGFYKFNDEPMLYYEDGVMTLNGAIKATSIDNSYFQVNSKVMGFFDRYGNPLFQYNNGSLTLTGAINATSLNIISNGESVDIDDYINSGMNLDDLIDRIEDVEFKVQKDYIIAAVRDSTEYQDDLAAIAITADQIISTVRSSDLYTTMQSSIDQNASEIAARVTSEELNGAVTTLQTKIDANTNSISSKITSGDAMSLIEQTLETITLSADQIDLHGYITANGNFSIDQEGTLTAKNGIFTGTFTAGYWTFNTSGYKYSNSSNGVKINMTLLTGGGYVGGGSDERAFYGSSGCDVQYGSDYDYNCLIRAKTIKIISQVGSVSDFRSAEFKKIDDFDDMTFVCGESDGVGSESGNIGSNEQPWDTVYVRKIFRTTESSLSSRSLKKDITIVNDVGSVLDQLVPVTFRYNWEKENDPVHHGLIYEDALEVMPDICDIPTNDDKTPHQPGIKYSELITPMLREIQLLRKRVSELEKKG